MSSIRDLKKDVKAMVKLFLDECYTQLAFSSHPNQENVYEIISDALELQREVIGKLAHKSRQRGVRANTDYRSVASHFYSRIVELADRLNSLCY